MILYRFGKDRGHSQTTLTARREGGSSNVNFTKYIWKILLSKAVNKVGGEVKKGQKSVNIVCERPHTLLLRAPLDGYSCSKISLEY